MKRGLTIKINLSNRWIYFLITLGILAIIAFGVYAITPGSKPDPGHSLSEIGVPADCLKNDSLKWNGTNLICSHTTALYTTPDGNLTLSPTYYKTQNCRTCTYNNVCGVSSITTYMQTQCDGSCPACPSSCTCVGTPPYVVWCSNMPSSCPLPNIFKGWIIN